MVKKPPPTVVAVHVSIADEIRITLEDAAGSQLGILRAYRRLVQQPGARINDRCMTSLYKVFGGTPPKTVATIFGEAEIVKPLRGYGWGVWMYAEMARLVWEHYQTALIADDCSGGKTSEPAKKVWKSTRLPQYATVDGHAMLWKGGPPMPRPDVDPARIKPSREASDPADSVGLLPLLHPLFNLREVCKQVVLLEDHLNQPRKRCPDCIRKHFLTIEALYEEAVSLDEAGEYLDVTYPGAEAVRTLQENWLLDADPRQVAQGLRSMRKKLLPLCFDLASMRRVACNPLPLPRSVAAIYQVRRAYCSHLTDDELDFSSPRNITVSEILSVLAYYITAYVHPVPDSFARVFARLEAGLEESADRPAAPFLLPYHTLGGADDVLELLLGVIDREAPEMWQWRPVRRWENLEGVLHDVITHVWNAAVFGCDLLEPEP